MFFVLALNVPANAGPYIEAGTSLGKISSGDAFFGLSGASGSAFIGSMSLYFTTPAVLNIAHFDIGLQNRLSLGSANGKKFSMLTPNLALRFEFWRFFAGAGGTLLPLAGTDNATSLKPKHGTYTFFIESGVIWNIIPEFQIVAAAGLEYGKGSSPSNLEYGLRFRFPLYPTEEAKRKGVKWDGFRYPFGVMRD